ncbi:MAG TPA: right-handed parallel beta-helix repeat-containing protein [Candidatus Dependentiae bacterium]|nr:right-handed parallel beta-helix repeat-containing protein [Candidatus Dependentiae bacterium]HRQ62696.1 right-handed parallel beta-helix repeat-containing protein [Candidatus Dependentiae bacterium]
MKRMLYTFLCLLSFLCSLQPVFAECGNINPQPGENLHGLTFRIGTEVDIVSSRQCIIESKVCDLSSVVDIIESIVDTVDSKVDIIESKVCIIESIVDVIDSKTDIIESKVCEIDSKLDDLIYTVSLCCECDFFITQADIPYTITQPGVYCVAEDLTLSGSINIITVAASCVTIELREHCIDGNGGGNNGIFVQNVNDILIRNGSITALGSGVGIRVEDSQFVTIQNVGITDCLANGCRISNSDNIIVENCGAYNTANGQGFFVLSGSSFVTFRDCVATGNGGNGFEVVSSSPGVCFFNCQSSDNDVDGFNIGLSSNVSILSNCIATNNTSDGIAIAADNCQIRGCSMTGNAVGVNNTGNGLIFCDSLVYDNLSQELIGIGDNCDACDFIIRQGDIPLLIATPGVWCVAEDLALGAPATSAIQVTSSCVTLDLQGHCIDGLGTLPNGIVVPDDITNVMIQNGFVTGVAGTAVSVTYGNNIIIENINAANSANGFIVAGNDVILRNCIAHENVSDGFALQNNISGRISARIMVDNCTSVDNIQTGFRITCTECYVSNCTADGNGLEGYSLVGDRVTMRSSNALNNGSDGIFVAGDNCEIRDSSVSSNAGIGIWALGATGLVVCNNLVHNNAGGDLVNVPGSNICQGLKNICSKIDELLLTTSLCCACDFVITQDDIPLTITTPGVWCLAEDINGGFAGLNAITVDTNDVTIELQGHMIDGQAVGARGIRLNPSAENITIQHGVIKDVITIALDLNGDYITVNDVDILMSGVGGAAVGVFLANSGTDCTFTNCRIYDTPSTGFSADGIGVIVKNCLVENAGASGFNIPDTSSNFCFIDCKANNCTSAGFSTFGAEHILNNCSAMSNVTGFAIGVSDSFVTNCMAGDNTTGFNFGILTNRCLVENCQAVGNSTGILVEGNEVQIIDSTSGSNTVGINGSASTGLVVCNNIVENNGTNLIGVMDSNLCNGQMEINSKLDELMYTVSLCCACDFAITQADIPLTIDTPGVWCLAEDIEFSSGNAITITTSCVTLNLQDHCIEGDGGAIGINITSSIVADVLIKNGQVKSSTGNAIILRGSNITVTNVQVSHAGGAGIQTVGASNVLIQDCRVYDGTLGGFSLDGQDMVLQNCIASGNGDAGFVVDAANSCLLQCKAINNSIPFLGTGAFHILANNCVLSECAALNTVSVLSGTANGFYVEGNDNVMRACDAQSNDDNGFEILGTNCEIRDSSSSSNISAGIRVTAGTPAQTLEVCNNLVHNNGINLVNTIDGDLCKMGCDFIIQQNDIPYTITVPGNYCLAESITVGASNGIIVAADDVTLDLKNKIIEGSGTDIALVITGTNVYVKDGLITNFENGISVESDAGFVSIENMIVNDCENTGIIVFNIETNVNNCSVNGGGLLGGIIGRAKEVSDCTIQDIIATGLQVGAGAVDPVVRNCTIQNTTPGVTGVAIATNNATIINTVVSNVVLGFEIVTTNNTLQNCIVCDATNYGFDVDGNNNIVIHSISNNSGIGGFLVGGDTNQLRDCEVSQTETGFVVEGAGNLFEKCTAINVTDGFYFDNTGAENLIQSCRVNSFTNSGFWDDALLGVNYFYNNSVGPADGGTGTGFVSVTIGPVVSPGSLTDTIGYWANVG